MKKFVNFRFIVTLVLAVFANVVTYAQDNVIDEVVWVVGDEAILKSDVEEARMDALYNGRRFEGDPYCVIPEEIAVQKLFLHQAKLDSIEVSEAEIIQRVDMMTNMYIQQIGSREKMEEYFNKTSTQIRETLRDNARDGLTVQKMQQKLVYYLGYRHHQLHTAERGKCQLLVDGTSGNAFGDYPRSVALSKPLIPKPAHCICHNRSCRNSHAIGGICTFPCADCH